jgi:hypothetical protein
MTPPAPPATALGLNWKTHKNYLAYAAPHRNFEESVSWTDITPLFHASATVRCTASSGVSAAPA